MSIKTTKVQIYVPLHNILQPYLIYAMSNLQRYPNPLARILSIHTQIFEQNYIQNLGEFTAIILENNVRDNIG